jgi:S-(hydroxymethyl)glutathione dehydrogenase/alcohol dehydrogenase
MKAAVLTELNKLLVLADVEPAPLGYGQVLVKVLVSGICGSQLQEIAGYKGNKPPHLLGHEGCGIVQDVGRAVTRVQKGDKVVMHWRKAAGIESEPPCYWLNEQYFTSGRVTTLSEYSICSENRLTPVPDDTPEDLCALLGCSLSTALGTLEREAQLRMGESVLVIGVGGLGCNLIKAARLMGAIPIHAFDTNERKELLAAELGATAFASQWPQFCSDLRTISTQAFDVVIETSGATEAITKGLQFTGPGGRFIMVGQPKPLADAVFSNVRHMFDGEGKTIKATQGGGFQPHLDIPRYVKMHQRRDLDVADIITHRMKLDDINEAIELVRQGNAGRILITP